MTLHDLVNECGGLSDVGRWRWCGEDEVGVQL